MKIYYKTKILINGIFPLVNFKIDEFTEKTGIYDDNGINIDNEDYIFYSSSFLIKGTYSCEEKEGGFYEYFENEEFFEKDLPNNITIGDIQKIIGNEQDEKVAMLEKKIRLITGLGITLPVFKTKIYNSKKEYLTYIGLIKWKFAPLDARNYDEKMKKKLEQRLQFRISDSTIKKLENQNLRFKRALYFYNKSFESFEIGIRFTLLISALEALFNITGKKVKEEISSYASKILFLSDKEQKQSKYELRNYYKERSKFIHGNQKYIISLNVENNLREYVREILFIYWNISTTYGIYSAKDIKRIIMTTDSEQLNIQCQLFIKYLRTAPINFKNLYNQIRTNFMNKDYRILNNEKLNIK